MLVWKRQPDKTETQGENVAVKEINDSNFSEETAKGLVMVDFWAPWCRPCRIVAPVLDEISEELSDQVSITKINVDDNDKTATKYNIISIPTVLVFKDGENVESIPGAKPKHEYMQVLSKYLNA